MKCAAAACTGQLAVDASTKAPSTADVPWTLCIDMVIESRMLPTVSVPMRYSSSSAFATQLVRHSRRTYRTTAYTISNMHI